MTERGYWQGMLTILRFNWPFYLAAGVGLLAGVAGMFFGDLAAVAGVLVAAGCLYFLIGSLGVSHWVYDRSDLYRLGWLDRALENRSPERGFVCHSGFDETSEMLARRFPSAVWRLLDHYDPITMTEASIRRARKRFPPVQGTLPAPYGHWPTEDGAADMIFGLLAIHELRSDAERAEWFAEARRCLVAGGRVILAEHVRDIANFVAFGPGFMHFHSVSAWRRSWESAGFTLHRSFRVTPFVRIFVLKQS